MLKRCESGCVNELQGTGCEAVRAISTWQAMAARIVAARANCERLAHRRSSASGPAAIDKVSRQLEQLEHLTNEMFVQYLGPILWHQFGMVASFARARAGWEQPPERERLQRERRYTPEGVRRDLRAIRTVALIGSQPDLLRRLTDTSHTARNYLSRSLLCEQDVNAILQRPFADIAKACTEILQSRILRGHRRGRRINEADDVLILGLLSAYEALTKRPAGRAAREGLFAKVLVLVFRLAGQARSVDALRARFKQLRSTDGTAPRRKSRLGPVVQFARKKRIH